MAVISLFVDQSTGRAQIRKFACLQQHQGRGYGSRLLEHAAAEAKHSGAASVLWCIARVEQAGYYEKRGLRRTGETFERAGKAYEIMERRL